MLSKHIFINWNESGLVENKKVALHLFVAYDLKYTGTKVSDYIIIDEEILDIVDSAYYIGNSAISNEAQYLVEKEVISSKEAKLIFGEGYAKKKYGFVFMNIYFVEYYLKN